MKEMVLYYAPENALHVGLVKGVLVQMGIRIKNLTSGRCKMKIGWSGLKKPEGLGRYEGNFNGIQCPLDRV